MAKTRIRELEREGKKELLKRFRSTVKEEREGLFYLREAIESVHKWENQRLYKIFLQDALIKLDRINDKRLCLQNELIENEELEDISDPE